MHGNRFNSPVDLHRYYRWGSLVAATAFLTIVWGVVLPRLAATPAIREMIQRNERHGVDPSAMFYSDLENMEYRDSMLRPRRDRGKSGT